MNDELGQLQDFIFHTDSGTMLILVFAEN